MNKRSILFVALMTLTFLAVNTFFSSDRDDRARKQMQSKTLAEAKENEYYMERVKKNKRALSELPLVSLYTASDEDKAFSQGVKLGEQLLFLSSEAQLPSKIYYSEGNSTKKEVSYVYGSAVEGSPQIYGKNTTALAYADISTRDDVDLQLLWINEENELQNSLGIWKDHGLKIPFEDPTSSAIALVDYKGKWLPCGIYQARERHFVPLSLFPEIGTHIELKGSSDLKFSSADKEERFYELSSPYQQLVFSNIGASLVAVNLPFASKEDPYSVVNPVEWDRQLLKDSSLNARFPLKEANGPQGKIAPKEGGYYPLLRRDLYLSPTKEFHIPHALRSCTISSDFPELASLPYKLVEHTDRKIVFEARQAHRTIRKTFSLPENASEQPYLFDLEIQIEGDHRNLWINTGLPEAEVSSGVPQAILKYSLSRDSKIEAEEISLPKPGATARTTSVRANWVANCGPFFGIVLYPVEGAGAGYKAETFPGEAIPSRLTLIDQDYDRFPSKDFPAHNLMLPLAPQNGSVHLKVYAGPLDSAVLEHVDASLEKTLGINPQLSEAQTFHGWFSFISKPISKALFFVMNLFKSFTSWGVAIILLTVVLRLFLYPLSAWSFRSMKRMQQISPQVQALQKKHKKDPKRAQMEVMKLYRQEKVNPFMGCLPILIQMPFLIGMFDLLRSNFALRGTSFISGWIDNLAAPDILFQWDYPIFFIGTEFHVLPLLVGLIMFLQQRLSSNAPKDPSQMTEQQRQQRTMGTIMTLFFSVMFYNLPAGVNLYWLSSMLLGFIQQWYTNKRLDKIYGDKAS